MVRALDTGSISRAWPAGDGPAAAAADPAGVEGLEGVERVEARVVTIFGCELEIFGLCWRGLVVGRLGPMGDGDEEVARQAQARLME